MLEDTLKGAKILIVDDQESNVRLLERLLQQGGYTTFQSTTDLDRCMSQVGFMSLVGAAHGAVPRRRSTGAPNGRRARSGESRSRSSARRTWWRRPGRAQLARTIPAPRWRLRSGQPKPAPNAHDAVQRLRVGIAVRLDQRRLPLDLVQGSHRVASIMLGRSAFTLNLISAPSLCSSSSHSAGTSTGAPLSLIKNTRNFAGLVLLAFRLTT